MERTSRTSELVELCPELSISTSIPSDEELADGSFLTIDDFYLTCEEYGIPRGSGTYVFKRLAYVLAEGYSSSSPDYECLYDQLFYDILNAYNTDKTLKHRLLIDTQVVYDMLDSGEAARFLGDKSIDILASVLYDRVPLMYTQGDDQTV